MANVTFFFHNSFMKAGCETECLEIITRIPFSFIFKYEWTSEIFPELLYLFRIWSCHSWHGNSHCSVLVCFLEHVQDCALHMQMLIQLCFLNWCVTLSMAETVGILSCNCSCLLQQQVMQGFDSHDGHMQALQKGCLVDYVGNNVNSFYYYVMCRTRKMWLLYDYHSVSIRLFYFVTCDYKTQNAM